MLCWMCLSSGRDRRAWRRHARRRTPDYRMWWWSGAGRYSRWWSIRSRYAISRPPTRWLSAACRFSCPAGTSRPAKMPWPITAPWPRRAVCIWRRGKRLSASSALRADFFACKAYAGSQARVKRQHGARGSCWCARGRSRTPGGSLSPVRTCRKCFPIYTSRRRSGGAMFW